MVLFMQKFISFLKQYVYIVLGIICILAVGVIYLTSRPATITINPIDVISNPQIEQSEPMESPEPVFPDVEYEPTLIMVHIVGAVNYPGVFELPEGSRVNDVVILAGGYTPEADLTRVNLAAFVHDAMRIMIPTVGEEIIGPDIVDNPPSGNAVGLVNINTATATELQTLPGVGSVLSGNIINFRETHGRFSTVEELINVSRIGAATLDRLRPLITV